MNGRWLISLSKPACSILENKIIQLLEMSASCCQCWTFDYIVISPQNLLYRRDLPLLCIYSYCIVNEHEIFQECEKNLTWNICRLIHALLGKQVMHVSKWASTWNSYFWTSLNKRKVVLFDRNIMIAPHEKCDDCNCNYQIMFWETCLNRAFPLACVLCWNYTLLVYLVNFLWK